MSISKTALALAFALAVSAPASAQLPSLGSLAGKGALPSTAGIPGAAGLLGGALPDVSSVGAGNAAGVLGYCIKNKYLGANGAAGVLDRLKGMTGVTSGPDYAAGQKGQLLTGGSSFSLTAMKDKLKTKLCDLVLSHAKSLI